MNTKYDESKLPKWAQKELYLLRANVEFYKEKAKSVEVGESDIKVNKYSDEAYYLPTDERVTFITEDGELDVYHSEGGIEVRAHPCLEVRPLVSNVIHVRVGSW